MASTKTLNAKNLETLGAARLAELLIELSTGDADRKRRLRLELAGVAGLDDLAHEISKRLATIARARSFVEWDKIKALAADLTTQHRAIVDQVAPRNPAEALALLWRFLALADPVLNRCDDSNGRIGGLFFSAVKNLGPLTAAVKADSVRMAEETFVLLQGNGHGQFDNLIETLAPALGPIGLEALKARFVAWGAEAMPTPPDAERKVIGWGSGGALYADQIERRHREMSVKLALKDIADALGDVEGFIAQYDERARAVPAVAAEIGRRLLDAGRPTEALAALDAATTRGGWLPIEWEHARIDALEALGRAEEAQAFRWTCFTRTLNPDHLRAHLKKLPDFEDFEAEQKALAHVVAYPSVHSALAFLLNWPALDRAARLVIERAADLDGNNYEILSPAAEVLAEKYPLAATIALRAMIDHTLKHAKSARYGHANRHLATCAGLGIRIEDFGDLPGHVAYVSALRAAHGRKTGFWKG